MTTTRFRERGGRTAAERADARHRSDMAIVVYPYKSEKENELTLTVGEALTLLKFELPGVCAVQQRRAPCLH